MVDKPDPGNQADQTTLVVVVCLLLSLLGLLLVIVSVVVDIHMLAWLGLALCVASLIWKHVWLRKIKSRDEESISEN